MNPTTILLASISFSILILGGITWYLTSSRSIFVSTFFASFCVLLAAYQTASRTQIEWAFILPFFATMIFGGRAIATLWRSRKEAELIQPSRLLAGITALTIVATVSGYRAQ